MSEPADAPDRESPTPPLARRRDGENARGPRCPTCGGPVAWAGNPTRPFCSVACKLIDLGVWLDEAYRVPGPPLPSEAPDDDRRPVGELSVFKR